MKTPKKIVGNIKIEEISKDRNVIRIINENFTIRIWNSHLTIVPKGEIGFDSSIHIHSFGLVEIAKGKIFTTIETLTDNDRWNLNELPQMFSIEEPNEYSYQKQAQEIYSSNPSFRRY